jgi:pimeloyl-ACP methyl ester carboxylesterase
MGDGPQQLLNYETVTAEAAAPAHWLFSLHGIYGAGRNWATVVRRVVRSRPEWGARLIDLREHGASQGFPPPHTIETAAGDLERLAAAVGRPAAVLGHSFGGKVALAWGRTAPAGLRQIWVVDSTPAAGPPHGSAWEMLSTLERMPGPFLSRDVAVAALMENGIAEPTARWMATNLEPDGDRVRWRFDLGVMRALLEDFFRTDEWEMIESPPDGITVHVVRALGASTIPDSMANRIRAIGERAAVHLHEVEGAHWLNVDNPDAMHTLLSESLSADG